MELDELEAKRYVLRELMDMMDKHEREKLKGSFKPDSEPYKKELDLQSTDMHEAGPMNSGSVAKEHEAAEGVTETPPSTGSSSDNDEDDEPVSLDPIVTYSKRRYSK